MVTYAHPAPVRAQPKNVVRPRADSGSADSSSNLSAPICHLPPTSDIPQGASQNLPSIPQPDGSIESIMQALEALIQGYNLMSGQQPQAGQQQQQNGKGSRFIETGRQTKKIHVTNPDDNTQFVDVQVVSHLELTDKVTGETWVWSL